MASNTLFPPIMKTTLPAFVVVGSVSVCRIYFSLSNLNSIQDLNQECVQVTITPQNSNESALKRDTYPCEIKLAKLNIDYTRDTDDKYYVEISGFDLEAGRFQFNMYYKVQLRFTSKDCPTPGDKSAIDSWLYRNLIYFSEWSTICLIRGISQPTLTITGFDDAATVTIWETTVLGVVGRMVFADPTESETMKSYRVRLYNIDMVLLSDSETVYCNNYTAINEFNYTFNYGLTDGESYYVEVNVETKNGYKTGSMWRFSVIQTVAEGNKLKATITAKADEENGRIGVRILGNTSGVFNGSITIRRASSDTNFTVWNDVHTTTLTDVSLDYTWYDYTIESGIWYKYCAQRRNWKGNRGFIIETISPVMIIFEHMYLTSRGRQICIKYNPSISSFKKTLSESKTDTIGSKFPFIKRNGYVGYREFPIGGLITYFMDEENIFTSREKTYGENEVLFDEYNDANWVTPYNDFVYERRFREQVMDFLYENNVKLFKSTTEGNVLVKLMDISFTPVQTLGRNIYSFSAMAYEVAEPTPENYDKYNIYPIGEYSKKIIYDKKVLGQITGEELKANQEIMDIIRQRVKKYAEVGYDMTMGSLNYLRIEMTSDPYPIKENSSGPYAVQDKPPSWDTQAASALLGYIVYINNQPIVLNKEGIYELKNPDTVVTNLRFPVNCEATIDYQTSLHQEENLTLTPNRVAYYEKMGQEWGGFEYNDSVFTKIWNKYYEEYTSYNQYLLTINELSIEADPGTVVYVKEATDKNFERHVIGQGCRLDFKDEGTIIEGIYFAGIHFEEATEAEKERGNMPDGKYIDTGLSVDSIDDEHIPIRNGVYTLRNNRYIWYNGEWRLFNNNNDLVYPVEAIVNYYCELIKEFY